MYDIFYVNGTNTGFSKIKSKYPRAQHITNISSYSDISAKSFTKLFWVIWNDVELADTFDLNEYRATKWDDMYVHVFKNGEYFDGICLFPKNLEITQREFNHRFFVAKKDINICASTPKQYPIHVINSYEQYLNITDSMFWAVWPEIEITDTNIFNLYFSHHNVYDRRENHVFKNTFNNTEIYPNGLILFSKEKKISQREFKHRFLIEKKEHDIVVSKHRLYDVVFISYNEPNADENYNRLLNKCPRAKRVHGVKGIHQAHIQAAQLCNTDMIWIVDGDAIVDDKFNFDLVMSSYDTDCVHVWRSRNPINDLEYGNGGVKLLPRQLTIDMDVNTSDMTTSISKKFKAMESVSNINSFNTDEFTTWRSAFRECCKLSSRIIERQHEEETQRRLDIWCSVGNDKLFGEYAIKGANAGRLYGEANKNNLDALIKINNFDWLREQFNGI
jgi:hypothetical protein